MILEFLTRMETISQMRLKPMGASIFQTFTSGLPSPLVSISKSGLPSPSVSLLMSGLPSIIIDTDGDGIPDINIDTDGDGIPDLNVDSDGDGKPDINVDTNGDGKPDKNSFTSEKNCRAIRYARQSFTSFKITWNCFSFYVQTVLPQTL